MDPVGRAIWYIESHFAGAISLDDIADVSGLSRYALSRAFGAATDRSVMRYVCGRRLTEAANRWPTAPRHPVAGAGNGVRVPRSLQPGVP